MKKSLIVVAVGLTMASCSNRAAVERRAYQYLVHTSAYDIEAARHYVTPETDSTTMVVARNLMVDVDSTYTASDRPAQLSLLRTTITDDTTATVCYHKRTPLKNFTDSLALRRRDGRWLIHNPM